MRTRVAVLSILAALLVLPWSVPAQAQATAGVVSGTVKDAATNAPLANVHVLLVAPSGRYEAYTNAKGFYSITSVFADTYTITFSLSGYSDVSLTDQDITAGQTSNVDATLSKA